MKTAPTAEFLSLLSTLIVTSLDDGLLHPRYRKPGKHLLFGHCYTASEALYHLTGGKKSGYQPQVCRIDSENTHWYLVNKNTGERLDLTAAQFDHPIPYEKGRNCGFLTAKPSKRAKKIIKRVRERLRMLGYKPLPA